MIEIKNKYGVVLKTVDSDLTGARLTGADLAGADLRGADLDYSCLPLWCGSFGMKADARLVYQIICHLTRLEVEDEGALAAIAAVWPWRNKFCGYRDDVKMIGDDGHA